MARKPALLSGSSPKDFLLRLFLIGGSLFSFKSIRLVVDDRIFRIFFVRSVSNGTISGFFETKAERFKDERTDFPLVRSERPHCRRRDFFDDGEVCENDLKIHFSRIPRTVVILHHDPPKSTYRVLPRRNF